MPRGNQTGPWGEGPRSGRAMGTCAGYDTPGYMRHGPGMGFGQGFGFRHGPGLGFGWDRGLRHPRLRSAYGMYPYAHPQPAPEDELRALKEEADALARHQEQIASRIQEIEKKD
ncbi:MAG: DUF5320 domain-containing protein [Candidatus Aminicenantaceae bacterium]